MDVHQGAVDSEPAALSASTVTVAVLVFNQARFVAECLDSVAESAYPPLEILIVDDASTDTSVAKVQSWRNDHPQIPTRIIARPSNVGVPANLNAALRGAQGRYVALVAGDDRLLPGGIACRVRYLESNPDALACFADCRVINDRGETLFPSGIEGLYRSHGMRKRYLLSRKLVLPSVVRHWAVPGPVLMLRRGALDAVGAFDETIPFGEDRDIYLRLAAKGRLGFVDEVVAEYRVHDASALRVRTRQVASSEARVAARHARGLRGMNRLFLTAQAAKLRASARGRYDPANILLKLALSSLRTLSALTLDLRWRAERLRRRSRPAGR